MNSRERFIATVERKPVDRPACWLGDPTPEAVPALCDYYHVDNIKELKKVCGDDFYAVEIPYKSPTCSAIFAAFDWYMNGSNVDTEHRTLTADGCFAQCEDSYGYALGLPLPGYLCCIRNADMPYEHGCRA